MESSSGLREFLAYHRRMLALLTAVCATGAVCLLVFVPGDYARLGGFTLGAAGQLLKFATLDVWLVKRMATDPEKAAMQQLKSRYGALALLAVVLVVSLKFKFNVWALAAGIFLPRVILLADTYLRPNIFAKPSSAAPDGRVENEKEA